MRKDLRGLLRRRNAATATEYGILVGLIAVTALGAIAAMGGSVADIFGKTEHDLSIASGAVAGFALEVGGDGSLAIPLTVRLTRAPEGDGPVSVHLSTLDGSAIAGTDYTALDTALTFPAGTLAQQIVLQGQPRAAWGGAPRTLTVQLDSPQGAALAVPSVGVTLPDGIAAPVAGFEASALTLPETDPATPVQAVLHLSQPLAQDAVAALSWSYGTASAEDLAALPAQVTIPAGDTAVAIPLAALPDSLQEDDETATLRLDGVTMGAATLALGDASVAVTVPANGDDPVVYLAALPAAPVQEGTATGFSVRLSHATYRPVTVTVTFDNGDTDAADWMLDGGAAPPLQVQFAAGETEAPVVLEILADTAEEQEESFGIALQSPQNATLASDDAAAPATGSIVIAANGSAPTASLAPASLSLAEGGAAQPFTLTLSNSTWHPVTVTLAPAGSGAEPAEAADLVLQAAAGASGVSVSGWEVTLAPGTASAALQLAAVDDEIAEASEDFTLTLSGIDPTPQAAASLSGSIADNDAQPVLALAAIGSEQAQVAETGGTATFTLSLDRPASHAIQVGYSWSGTATLGSDFTASPASPLTIAAGATSATVTLTAIADGIDEPDETATLVLDSGISGATLGNAQTEVTLVDGDATPTASFASATGDGSLAETGGTLSFTVTLSGASSSTVTVPFALAGSAAPGTDFSISPASSVSFAPGETQKTVTVAAIADSVYEGDETVIVTLGTPAGAAAGSDLTRTATITDAQNQPTVAFASATPDGTLAEPGGTRSFRIELSTASATAIGVPFAVTGSAAPGTDFSISPASPIGFAPGDTQKTVTVTGIADSVFEGNETVIVTLGTPTGATAGSDLTRTATITDAQNQPTVAFASATPDGTLAESGGTRSFRIELSTASATAISVPFAVTGSAAPGTDFSISPASPIAFAPGDTQKTVTVTGIADSVYEGNETVVVTLGTPTGAAAGSDLTRTATITDAQNQPTVAFASATPDGTLAESGGTRSFRIELSTASATEVRVPFAVTGSAAPGTDFSISPASPIAFAPGDTQKTVTVTGIADSVYEGNETVILTLGTPTGATAGSDLTRTATITDAQGAPTVAFDAATAGGSMSEVGGTVSFTVRLSGAKATATQIAFSLSGSAVNGTDYSTSANPLTIAGGETQGTLTVTAIDNAAWADDKSLTVTLTGGATLGSDIARSVTVINDDFLASCAAIHAARPGAGSGTYPVAIGGARVDVACDMTREGGGWTLVRTVPAGGVWWAADDNWSCGQALGGVPVKGAPAMAGVSFCGMGASQVLLTTGDAARWMRVALSTIQGPYQDEQSCDDPVTVYAAWDGFTGTASTCKRYQQHEDPWLSTQYHGYNNTTAASDNDSFSMLWGENSSSGWQYWRDHRGGIEAWVR